MRKILQCMVLAAALAPLPGYAQSVIASGSFRDADFAHRGEGTATIMREDNGSLVLRLEAFSATPGPDLKVWLVETASVQNSGDVKASKYLSLGPLQNPEGNQTYAIPADADIEAYKSVTIWCEAFGVLFAAADLTPK